MSAIKNIIEAMKLAMSTLQEIYLKLGLHRSGDNMYISISYGVSGITYGCNGGY